MQVQNKRRRRASLVAVAIGIPVALAAYLLPLNPDEQPQTPEQAPVADTAAAAMDAVPMLTARAVTATAKSPVRFAPDDLAFLDKLRGKFKSAIQNKHSQIKAIEQLIAYLMQRYPDDWAERVQAFLQLLFPELAAELLEQFNHLTQYNDWLRLHREELLKMPAAERRKALWDARRAAFGDDAAEIFAGEARTERMQQSLAALELAQNKTFSEKTTVFLDSVKQAYGDQAESFIQNRQTELLNSFLDVASVQNDLRAMASAERSAALREVRGALGMDDAALDRWSTLDHSRDQSWDQGRSYLQERSRILEQSQGEDQQGKLHQYQDQTFGADADTIRNEEQAGYFRFDHPRRLGRE